MQFSGKKRKKKEKKYAQVVAGSERKFYHNFISRHFEKEKTSKSSMTDNFKHMTNKLD